MLFKSFFASNFKSLCLFIGCKQITEVNKASNSIILHKPTKGELPKTFSYDAVYSTDSKQNEVYDESAFPLVESVLEGYNGTIFAYGQTGWGKTHSMVGIQDDEEQMGIIPRAYMHIFGCIDDAKEGVKFLVRCSYLEIYNESILDLMGDKHEK